MGILPNKTCPSLQVLLTGLTFFLYVRQLAAHDVIQRSHFSCSSFLGIPAVIELSLCTYFGEKLFQQFLVLFVEENSFFRLFFTIVTCVRKAGRKKPHVESRLKHSGWQMLGKYDTTCAPLRPLMLEKFCIEHRVASTLGTKERAVFALRVRNMLGRRVSVGSQNVLRS